MSEKIKIGIVGLGLIGGSLEKRLQQFPEQFEIFSVSESQQRPYKMEDLAGVDLLFLCSQQSQIAKQLEKIARIISRSSEEGSIPEDQRAFAKTIITDVGSTKMKISEKAQELGLTNFIAGHPMAGTEHQGYEASFPELFQDAKWILAQTDEKTSLLEKIITETLGAYIEIMDAETHDRMVAVTSHLPLLISLGLGNMVANLPQAQKVIGPGFKGMVRLAKGNLEMSREIVALNKDNIIDSWELFRTEIDALLNISSKHFEEEMIEIREALLQLSC